MIPQPSLQKTPLVIPFFDQDFSRHVQYESQFGSLPRVSTCVHGHCDRLFPQFNVLTEEDFKTEIDSAINRIESQPDSYFMRDMASKVEQLTLYKQCKDLPFPEAIILLHETTKDRQFHYNSHDLYASMRGHRVLRLQSCCR